MRRILALAIALAAVVSPAFLLGGRYLGEHIAPASFVNELVCFQHTDPPCAPPDTSFAAGVLLRMTGVALCLLAVLLGALLLLRLTRQSRTTLAMTFLAVAGGASGLWLSQQAFDWYPRLLLVTSPAGAQVHFMGMVTQRDTVAQFYSTAGVIILTLLVIALPISLALLWAATESREVSAVEAPSQRRFSLGHIFALGVFGCLLLAPTIVLGMAFQLDTPSPCKYRAAASCASLDTIVGAGTVMRGVGISLAGLAIVFGCALLIRSRPRWAPPLGLPIITFGGSAWLLWFSQRILDEYLLAPWNIATSLPGDFDGRFDLLVHLAQYYKYWSIGSALLAVAIAIAGALIASGGNGRNLGAVPLAPAR
jgi:hypothetical protein